MIGGIVATSSDGFVEYCRNEGNLKGPEGIGGIIGSGNSKISCCINEGNITEYNGEGYKWNLNIGGIVGGRTGGTIEKCVNEGEIKCPKKEQVGGIIGAGEGDIISCRNVGNIEGSNGTGGIAGVFSGSLDHVYSSGNVTSTGYYGLLFGQVKKDPSTISNCFYYGDLEHDLIYKKEGVIEEEIKVEKAENLNNKLKELGDDFVRSDDGLPKLRWER